jgi:alpha-tubulin suppressor-like RCC1 family protein
VWVSPAGPVALLTAVLVAVTCGTGSAAAAARPVAAAPPTELALATGDNDFGQLGDGTTTERHTPVEVALPEGVSITQIAAGVWHSLALTSDGRVLAWGDNEYGQLGDGTTTSSNTPVEVALPEGVTVTQIAIGHHYSLAVTSDGRGLGWGWNGYGELGDGTTTSRDTPVEVALPAGVTITQISGQYVHSLAVTSDGRALAWGWNGQGELGDGTTTQRLTPIEAALPPGVTVTQVAAGGNQSLALTSDGGALAWGWNGYGQLGDGTTTDRYTPVPVALPPGVTLTEVAYGSVQALALTSDGRALAWGYNAHGQLGDGTTTDRYTPVPVALPDGVTVTQISGGLNHSLALTSDRRALAWGANRSGQLGEGTTTERTTPVWMVLPEGSVATAVAGGYGHSFVLAQPIRSTTSLTADPTQATAGDPVILTATVTCDGGTPTGTVTFLTGDTILDTAELDTTGTATLTTTDLGQGQHRLTARYEGNATCPASTSPPVTITITPRPKPCPNALTVTNTADRTIVPLRGRVRYRVTVRNTCPTPYNATITGTLSRHGRIRPPITKTIGTITRPRPRTFIWTATLAPGQKATLTYTAIATRPGRLTNTITWPCRPQRLCTRKTHTRVLRHSHEKPTLPRPTNTH